MEEREKRAYKGFTPRMGVYVVRHLPELPPLGDAQGRDPEGDLAELEGLWRERLGRSEANSYRGRA